MTLEAKIEAILFFKGEPMSTKRLATLLSVSEEEISQGILALEQNLAQRGLTLIHKEKEVMLVTSEGASDLIAQITKEELTRDLGKAGLETLSIIIYRGPVSRREIDYIRGVNSAFIVRNLLVRGLVERVGSEKDERVFLYKPTFELLSYLGVTAVENLPEYDTVRKEIEEHKKAQETEKKDTQDNPETYNA